MTIHSDILVSHLNRTIEERTGELATVKAQLQREILKRKQAEDALSQLNQELTTFKYMSNVLHACQTEDETYAAVIDVCRLLFPSDSGCVYIMDVSGKMVEARGSWGRISGCPFGVRR